MYWKEQWLKIQETNILVFMLLLSITESVPSRSSIATHNSHPNAFKGNSFPVFTTAVNYGASRLEVST